MMSDVPEIQATIDAVVHLLVQILILFLQLRVKLGMPAGHVAARCLSHLAGSTHVNILQRFTFAKKDMCISQFLSAESWSRSLHDDCPSSSEFADASRCDGLTAEAHLHSKPGVKHGLCSNWQPEQPRALVSLEL